MKKIVAWLVWFVECTVMYLNFLCVAEVKVKGWIPYGRIPGFQWYNLLEKEYQNYMFAEFLMYVVRHSKHPCKKCKKLYLVCNLNRDENTSDFGECVTLGY